MDGRYDIGDVVLGNWTLTKLIGEGSFGKVYEARREDFGQTYMAAIKIIAVPQSRSEIESAMADGLDDESVTSYFRGLVEEMVNEFALMAKLKGHSNIVSYEDHAVVQHDEGIGWDIIIRMELLTPLLTYTRERRLTEQDAARLGADICRALELCRRYNIIHRDIKPENIFVSDTGDFKLGDFGIARTAEKTAGGMSKKGTYTYMAPEVYRDEPYGPGVDIYSLGIVLYRLLNENRTPFLPDYPAPITHGDRDAALARRMGGEPLPRPKNGGDKFAGIVLKACACDPKDRYPEPETMRRELEALIEENTSAGGYLGEDDHSDDPSLPGDGETESAAAVPEEETSDETKSAMSETKSAAAPPAPKLKNRDVVRLVLISAAIILGSFIAAFIMAGSGLLLLGFLILVGGMVGTVYFLRGEKRKRNGTGTEKR